MHAFRLNGSRVLEIDLRGDAVRAASGSMIAYTGEVTFRNAGTGVVTASGPPSSAEPPASRCH